MYDLVIPLGIGSIWQNNEVRYCIRSFVKNFSELGKIFIVGQKPEFLKWSNPRLIHIESNDPFRKNKDGNLIYKVLKVCSREDLSYDFIRCSDDQLVIKKVTVNDFYPKYLIEINRPPVSNNRWKLRVWRTIEELKRVNKPTYHYETHVPMIYNKDSFIEVMNKYPIVDKSGYTINTLYFNYILEEHKQLENIKLTMQRPIMTMDEMMKQVDGKIFLGYNNKGLRDGVLKSWIQQNFSQKTEFEI